MNKYIYIALACVTLSGCSNNEEVSSTDDTLTPILLSAGVTDVVTEGQAKSARDAAATTFPNKGKISVIAANHGANTNWNSINFTDNATTTGSSTTYTFTWDESAVHYWPFNPDEKLVFVACSPAISTDGVITAISGNKTSFNITLKGAADADVMYTEPTTAMNKSNGTVNLGEFKHALAKVQVVVKIVDTSGNDVTGSNIFSVTEVKFNTKVTTGTLNLTDNSNKLTSGEPVSSAASYTLYSGTHVLTSQLTKECYVFPGSENNSSVTLKLKDIQGPTSSYTYDITAFTKTKANESIGFVAAQTTVLTFKVQVKTSDTEDDTNNIILEGDLTDWECNGKFEVGIE